MKVADHLYMAGIRALPRKRLSRTVGGLAGLRARMAVRRFAALYDLDLSEAEKPLEAYESVRELFARRLKPGARPIDPRPEVLVSPVDGTLVQAGATAGSATAAGTLPQAKGRRYSLTALLASASAAPFADGSFAVLYLSPRDYHGVHAPADAEVVGYTTVPGDLYPVNPTSVNHVDSLYARNERVVVHLRTARFGEVALVMIGATNVGRITLTFAPELATNRKGARIVRKRYDSPIPVSRGARIGAFDLGSTVILLLERRVEYGELGAGGRVRTGARLGQRREI